MIIPKEIRQRFQAGGHVIADRGNRQVRASWRHNKVEIERHIGDLDVRTLNTWPGHEYLYNALGLTELSHGLLVTSPCLHVYSVTPKFRLSKVI